MATITDLFECSTIKRYFSQAEQNHLDKFLKKEVTVGFVYENKKREKRHILKIALPLGLITKETVYYQDTFGDPGMGIPAYQLYHTPTAKLRDTVLAKIDYRTDDGDSQCSSKEWLKWLGTDYNVEPVPEAPQPDYSGRLNSMIAMQRQARSAEDYDKESKEDYTLSGGRIKKQ